MSEDKPKMINLLLADNVGISEVGVLDGNGPTGEGIRRVDSDGHSSGTDQRGDDVQESISGPTVKGEEGTEQTCEILMEKLNHDGGEWVRVESPTSLDRIDGFLHSGSTEIDPLPIQVTKAYPAIWGELARNPSGVSKNRDVNEIRQTLMEAIEKKKAHADPKVVLALAAVHSPVAKLAVDKFIETAQNKARAIGFKEIWLVGPTVSHTHKLT